MSSSNHTGIDDPAKALAPWLASSPARSPWVRRHLRAAADVGPFASAFWRVFLALPLLWAWDRWENQGRPSVLPGFWSVPFLIAGLLFAGDLFFWHLAITNTTVANATFFATRRSG